MPGPRIYNLFPLLAGPVPQWSDHLERIAAMAFDWVFVNPFHYPGFSGSLYAIKDYYRLHPLLAADGADPQSLLKGFTRAAAKRRIAVMMDLVINHTSKDSVLVAEHPEWFRRDPDGELRSPRAIDPTDPRKFTVWGDLAEIAYDNPNTRPALVEYWVELVEHHLKLGFKGFRCDAAYQVPVEVWQPIVRHAKALDPACRFFAETLGCTPDQALALRGAGFDFLFNSAKWWDFRAPWLLAQYDLYRQIAPTVAFPESHDTERLAMELGDPEPPELERHYRLRYLFAAAFSSGVMMPMGYEYGCRTPLDVVGSRPGDWAWETAEPRLDLTGFVGAVNRMKSATPALNVEGPQKRVTAPHSPVVGLLRLSGGDVASSEDAAIVLINPDPARLHGIDPGPLINQAGGRIGGFEDVTPDGPALPFEPGRPISLDPLTLRVFRGHATALEPVARRGKAAAAADEKRLLELARNRVVIERLEPELDCGRHAIKRVAGDVVEVTADIFCDGHDKIAACIRYRAQDEADWREAPMAFVDNDRWGGRFPVHRNCRYFYTIEAWRDLFESWRAEVMKKHDAGLDVGLELIEGRALIERTEEQAQGADRHALQALLGELEAQRGDQGALLYRMLAEEVRALMSRAGIRTNASRYAHELEVFVDRPLAKFAAWYEMFPRSQSGDPNRHGTFDDVIERLPYVQSMGFDVLYFTPIHPIGRANRKGRNNTLTPAPDDPGSPYAIGSEAGGHDALHPELGTFDDFHRLVEAAHAHGLEIALDFAIQCSPDHPWIKEHPEWFDWRPDGTIKYAENPPKKYEDIVNVHFYRGALPTIWYALRDVVLFWVGHGVKIFRVDNPHTKPVPFWTWLIREVLDRHPDVDFPRRGVHPAEDDAAAGQGRLHPELLLFHLAQYQAGADRVSDRADPGRSQGVHAAELLRQHAGHQPGLPADQRPRGLSGAPRARGDVVHGVRHLQRLRAVRGHADPGQGGVSRFGEVRDQGLGLRSTRQHPRLRCAPQPDPPGQSGAAGVYQSAFLQRLERQHHLLRQDERGQGQYRAGRGQPRPAPRAGGQLRGAAVGAQPAGLGGRRGRGSVHRQQVRLARQGAARLARPGRQSVRHLADHAARPAGLTSLPRRPTTGTRDGMIDRSQADWYKDAVIYQLHIKAFFDANNDGIGDFAGLMQKLDYVQELGVNTVWLLPFYPSPLRDDGYDIADYRNVNPSFGTLRDVRTFVKAAHERGAAGDHRAGDQPHLGPAPLVPTRAHGQARISASELLRLERQRSALSGDPHHLHRYRAVELDMGPGRAAVFLAPLLSPSA